MDNAPERDRDYDALREENARLTQERRRFEHQEAILENLEAAVKRLTQERDAEKRRVDEAEAKLAVARESLKVFEEFLWRFLLKWHESLPTETENHLEKVRKEIYATLGELEEK